jgi:hypothetical protein
MKPQRDLTDEGRPALRPTPQRHRHDAIEVPPVDRTNPIARPARVETQTTLDRYKRRKTLTEDQLTAAYRWHAYAMRSKRFPKCTMSWQGPINGSNELMADTQVSAGIQRDNGIKHLEAFPKHGPLMVSIVEHVCVDDHYAEAWSVKNGFHPMKGIKLLRKALDLMGIYYGIRR